MKKLICAMMATAVVFSMAACSSSGEIETSVPTTTQNTAQTTTRAVDAFEEIVLANDENATVKITTIEEDNIWSCTVNP